MSGIGMNDRQEPDQLRFVKIDPAGNTTILVLDAVQADRRSLVARKLMGASEVFAEQAAFIDASPPRPCDMGIQMMGGEFCGNAVRSAAAWKVFDRQRWQPIPSYGEKAELEISCSGIDHNVRCTVMQRGRSEFDVMADMPLPVSVGPISLGGYTFWRAVFPGIVHYCFFHDEEMTAADKKKITEMVLEHFPVPAGSAEGILFRCGDRLDPFVYVKDTDTLINESSCGSGTAAAAACEAVMNRRMFVKIRAVQAGGTIVGEADCANGCVTSLRIGGLVRITSEGMAYL